MDSEETEHVARAFKKQTRFVQSLPVPLDMWDRWVREESTGAGQYAVDPSHQRVDDIDDLREDPPRATVPGAVYDYLTELKALFDILRQNNPTYRRLLEEIEASIETDEQLAVLFRKRSSQQAFEFALREDLSQQVEELNERGVYIVRLDDLRQLQGVDNLITTHPLAPSQTQFYLSPLYEKMRLIVYDQETDEYVSSNVAKQRSTLKSRKEIPEDANWPAQPTVDAVTQLAEEVPEASDEALTKESNRPDVDRDSLISEMWAQFEPDSQPDAKTAEAQLETGDGSGNTWTIRVLTEEGVELLKPSDESILIERYRGPMAGNQFAWTTMADLQPGDDFVLVPDDVRQRLFREALKEVYGDELDGTDLLEGLRIWWESLREISEAYDEFQTIYTLLEQSGIRKSESTVKDWFDAVMKAHGPVDLPMNPDIRIGPDSAADIETVGQTFNYPSLVADASSIEHAMQLSRGKNRSKGKELNEWIVSQIQDADSDFLEEVSEHTVGTIQHLGKQR
jgi:hypothetical protein